MTGRPTTHAGSWYSDDSVVLRKQLSSYFKLAKSTICEIYPEFDHYIPNTRVLIGPHAGYSYCGSTLAETYLAWDVSREISNIFIIGPSHHIGFANYVLTTGFDSYQTPLGDLKVNTSLIKQLTKNNFIRYMPSDVDLDEHSFEMHAPFLKYKLQKYYSHADPKIIPILVLDADEALTHNLVKILSPYINDPSNHFIISSDFCHWGERFGYTKYFDRNDQLVNYSLSKASLPIYKSIEKLDKLGMTTISKGDYKEWKKYIKETKNTICGRNPITIVLNLLQENDIDSRFDWIGYTQSNQATKSSDASVSYASGYISLNK